MEFAEALAMLAMFLIPSFGLTNFRKAAEHPELAKLAGTLALWPRTKLVNP